jgi:Holliday junction resolvasome RuvABC DNA-binding subunit
MTYTNDELREAFRQTKQSVDVDEEELRDLGYKEDEIQRMLSR